MMGDIYKNSRDRDMLVSRISSACSSNDQSSSLTERIKHLEEENALLRRKNKKLEKINRMLKANCSKSVMRRLVTQCTDMDESDVEQ